MVEDGSAEFSWGKEVAYEIQCNELNKLKSPVICIGSKLSVIPASFDLEQQVIINSKQIENAIMMVLK